MYKSKQKWGQNFETLTTDKDFSSQFLLKNNVSEDSLKIKSFSEYSFEFDNSKQILDVLKTNKDKVIRIIGDYDVDGIMSTLIAHALLGKIGYLKIDAYIPNRFTDGYGLNEQIVRKAYDDGVEIIITVDNGVKAYEAIALARELNMILIVTDHHHIDKEVNTLLLHPEKGEVNDGMNVCGAATIWSLLKQVDNAFAQFFLPHVCLATLADSMPVLGINRYFIIAGKMNLDNINNNLIRVILKKIDVDCSNITEIQFKLIPLLNAIGRMGDVNQYLPYFLDNGASMEDLDKVSEEIIQINIERKKMSDFISAEALRLVVKEASIIILSSRDWHEGVLGIAASKIVEATNKPVILFCEKDGILKGSGRSVGGINLLELVAKSRNLLTSYGGHKEAFGISLSKENFNAFYLETQLHTVEPPPKKIDFKLEFKSSKEILSVVNEMKKLEPFGIGLPKPIFKTCAKIVNVKQMGSTKQHIKITLSNGLQCIIFNEPNGWRINENSNLHVLGTLSENIWQNNITPQLIVSDWQIMGVEITSPKQQILAPDQVEKLSVIPSSKQEMNKKIATLDFEKLIQVDWLHDAQKVYNPTTREQFNYVYKILSLKRELHLTKDTIANFSKFGVQKKQIKLIINVFLELKFVIIENEVIKFNETLERKQLTDSKLYAINQFQTYFIEKYVYNTLEELQQALQLKEI